MHVGLAVQSLISLGTLRLDRSVALLPRPDHVGAETRSPGNDFDRMSNYCLRHASLFGLKRNIFNSNLQSSRATGAPEPAGIPEFKVHSDTLSALPQDFPPCPESGCWHLLDKIEQKLDNQLTPMEGWARRRGL